MYSGAIGKSSGVVGVGKWDSLSSAEPLFSFTPRASPSELQSELLFYDFAIGHKWLKLLTGEVLLNNQRSPI